MFYYKIIKNLYYYLKKSFLFFIYKSLIKNINILI
jgi:hypothetical protein